MKTGSWELPPYSYEELLCGNMIFSTAFFRRSDWIAVGGYDEKLILGLEDYAFWLRLVDKGVHVYRIEDELFFYRIKADSRSAQLAQENRYKQALHMVHVSCADIFSKHSDILLQKLAELQNNKTRLECLLSWKLFSILFQCEWALRQYIKKLLRRI